MLKRLRWQLAALYLLAAIGLVTLVVGSSYSLLKYFYESTTDEALQYKMATVFQDYSIPLPASLVAAEQTWIRKYGQPAPTPTPPPTPIPQISSDGEEEDDSHSSDHTLLPTTAASKPSERHKEDVYDASLATIFVMPLDNNGGLLPTSSTVPAPIAQDETARQAALSKGSDLRTLQLSDGTLVRLLSYRTNSLDGPAVIQIGRTLSDQSRLLNLYLTGLLALGAVLSLLFVTASWWLSGRSIYPAQRAWDQQQAFVSNASHELRTPLTLIRATADYGLRSQPPPEQAALLEDILEDCDYMNSLVDDLLLLSRLDTRRLELQHELIRVSELFSETRRQVEILARDKGVTLTTGADAGSFWGDPTRMRQVLLIFLDNSLRYTPSGGHIHFESQVHGKQVHISLQDNGAGIPPEHVKHVFERFYHVTDSENSSSRNSGLGLSIAKSLVEAQHGRIHLESQLKVGTRITMSFPNADVSSRR